MTTSTRLPAPGKQFFFPGMIVPFVLIACCFAAWGLAQDLTTPLVAAFQGIFTMSTFEASLVQFAFYGAYFLLALPAAFINRRWGYKAGVLSGLGLAALGAIGFLPAANSLTFGFFLIALFVLAAGLSILETSASPFVISMGPEESGTRRLNLAQAFNPIGTNLGVLIAAVMILPRMNPATAAERSAMPDQSLLAIQKSELFAIMGPYLALAGLLLVIWVGIAWVKVPATRTDEVGSLAPGEIGGVLRRLFANRHWRYGVLTQFAYVGAQVCTWTYIVIYVANVVPGGDNVQGAWFLQIGLIVYLVMRFVMTWLMGYIRPTLLMSIMAGAAIVLSIYAWLNPGLSGAWALVAVSGTMCLMFPTIYGVALHGLGEDTKFGASGLVMAIVGGALLPPLQGYLTDVFGSPTALLVPTACFAVVLAYAIYDLRSGRTYGVAEPAGA
ncbi:L-fucose:H+ symporter permease [Brachybacterium tyrofermentans]|uniref:L-fucose:H+ symporter permease n=1 Tax=Brachybacterium tyrofermentans TaxID=47848 RepID=A0ABW0FGU8_9MICO